jgi:hypothetical protein
MTFALKLAQVADAISNISVSGVTVKDIDQMAGSWVATPNVFYPNVNAPWVTDFRFDWQSVLRGSNAPVNVYYNLHYRFLSVQVGDLAIQPTAFNNLITKMIGIINALEGVSTLLSGSVTMEITAISNILRLEDLAGNLFSGCDFTLSIMELQN